MPRFALIMVSGAFDSGVSAVLDVFSTANALTGRPRFEVVRVGATQNISTGQAARHRVLPYARARERFDAVIVPGFGASSADIVKQRLRERDLVRTIDWVADQFARRAQLFAACSGTWIAGAAGLLDDREATTSWWFADAFRRHFPKVRLDATQAVLRSGPVTTAGAAFAHIDLALALLQRDSPELAQRVAAHLVTESRPSQALYLAQHHAQVDDAVVRAFEHDVVADLQEPFSLKRTARLLGTSTRTLQRKVYDSTGKSPVQFVQRLRLQRAVALIQQGDTSLESIANQVGYANAHTLRQLIRRELNVGIQQLKGRQLRARPCYQAAQYGNAPK